VLSVERPGPDVAPTHPTFDTLSTPDVEPRCHVEIPAKKETAPDVCQCPDLLALIPWHPPITSIVQVAQPPRPGTSTVANGVLFAFVFHHVAKINLWYPAQRQKENPQFPVNPCHVFASQ
jgi:hypothetical protein